MQNFQIRLFRIVSMIYRLFVFISEFLSSKKSKVLQIRLFRIVSRSSRRVPTTLTTTGAAEAAGKAATSSSAKTHLLLVSKIPDNLKLRLEADENPATSSSAKAHQLFKTKRT